MRDDQDFFLRVSVPSCTRIAAIPTTITQAMSPVAPYQG